MFWFAVAVLLLVAGMLVAWPLLRRPPSAAPLASREETVRALYQDRLTELDAEAAAGQLAPEDREEVEAELSSTLLTDFSSADAGSASQPGESASAASTWRVFATAAVAVAAAFWIYLALGDPTADALKDARGVLSLNPHSDAEALESWRDRLNERVGAKPGEAESWYLLGHTELLLGQYQQAAAAFAVAHAQHGADPSIDLAWLQARYMAAGGQVDAVTRDIANRVLEQDPNQPLVLELFAVDAFREGRYQESVSYLNRALSRAVGPKQQAALQAGLDEARKQMGDLTPSVDVNVALEGSPPPGATLFVIARPVGGGMPFAVVRRSSAQFPLSVRLDDAVSMNPAMGLSKAPAVEVVVRLSLTGAPMSHPGDWEWQSGEIALPGNGVPIQLQAALAPPATES